MVARYGMVGEDIHSVAVWLAISTEGVQRSGKCLRMDHEEPVYCAHPSLSGLLSNFG